MCDWSGSLRGVNSLEQFVFAEPSWSCHPCGFLKSVFKKSAFLGLWNLNKTEPSFSCLLWGGVFILFGFLFVFFCFCWWLLAFGGFWFLFLCWLLVAFGFWLLFLCLPLVASLGFWLLWLFWLPLLQSGAARKEGKGKGKGKRKRK